MIGLIKRAHNGTFLIAPAGLRLQTGHHFLWPTVGVGVEDCLGGENYFP